MGQLLLHVHVHLQLLLESGDWCCAHPCCGPVGAVPARHCCSLSAAGAVLRPAGSGLPAGSTGLLKRGKATKHAELQRVDGGSAANAPDCSADTYLVDRHDLAGLVVPVGLWPQDLDLHAREHNNGTEFHIMMQSWGVQTQACCISALWVTALLQARVVFLRPTLEPRLGPTSFLGAALGAASAASARTTSLAARWGLAASKQKRFTISVFRLDKPRAQPAWLLQTKLYLY